MPDIHFIFKCVVLLLIFTCATSSSSPHIIILVADDLGWNDVGFHGSPQIPTPKLDALASSGIILNNYYVSPICSPTRSALMTGLHPIHTGLQHQVIFATEPWGLPLDKVLLPEWLKLLGYSTHAVGKWHLGFFHKEYTPTHRGFDSSYGYWSGREDYYDHTLQLGDKWGIDFHHNFDTIKDAIGKYSTTLFTEQAENIIEQHNKSDPLFLYLAYQAVHSANDYAPLQAPPEYVAKFPYIKDTQRRIFAGMVSCVDDSVGRIVKALENNDMLSNSIIIFTTDNGGPAAGFNSNAASNWPLRGVKTGLWEGGVRGVGLISSPLLKTHAGKISMGMMHVTDWLPTLFHAAGGNVSLLGNIDGIDLWDALQLGSPSPRKEVLHNINPIDGVSALRYGHMKLINGTLYRGQWDGWYGPSGYNDTKFSNPLNSVRTNETLWKHQENSTFPEKAVRISPSVNCGPVPKNASTSCKPLKSPCLFDIYKDPCEYNNIADQHPAVVQSLLKRLQFYKRTMVPPGDKPPDPRSAPKYHGYEWINWMDYMN